MRRGIDYYEGKDQAVLITLCEHCVFDTTGQLMKQYAQQERHAIRGGHTMTDKHLFLLMKVTRKCTMRKNSSEI